MSKEDSKEEEAATSVEEEVCANCGIAAAGDDIKLKTCACKLVKYCTVNCQKEHRSQHKKACKMGLAKLRDDNLFKMPDGSHLGECPLCCLPLSLDPQLSSLTSCCSQMICDGCGYANQKRDAESQVHPKCPFCREPYVMSMEEAERNVAKRIKAGDPVAFRQKGIDAKMAGNYNVALEYLTKAAKMGDAVAHYQLGEMHYAAQGVERDMKKVIHHYEEAAIGGHTEARHNLGTIENNNYLRYERAVKHYIIAASLGFDPSLSALQDLYKIGRVKKEDLAAAYRAHHAAVEGTKSSQREEAKGAARL